jgi:hypothetical protein
MQMADKTRNPLAFVMVSTRYLLTQSKNTCAQSTPIYAEGRSLICVNLRNLRMVTKPVDEQDKAILL